MNLKHKWEFIFLLGGLLFIVVFGSFMSEKTNDDYDDAYYVEANGNLITKTAKVIDKGCFYMVDIVVSGIGSIFNAILGN